MLSSLYMTTVTCMSLLRPVGGVCVEGGMGVGGEGSAPRRPLAFLRAFTRGRQKGKREFGEECGWGAEERAREREHEGGKC